MLEYTLVLERDYSHYIFSIEYTEYSLLLNSVDTHTHRNVYINNNKLIIEGGEAANISTNDNVQIGTNKSIVLKFEKKF